MTRITFQFIKVTYALSAPLATSASKWTDGAMSRTGINNQ